MRFPSVTVEGSVLSSDILERISGGDYPGQSRDDFGLDSQVREEIAQCWADARSLWGVFKRQMGREVRSDPNGTTRTRNLWMVPLLELLGYDLELYRRAPVVQDKTYAISHRAGNRGDTPVHVIGFSENIEDRDTRLRSSMSPHSMVQEYLNLSEEQLYAIVTNGLKFRVLRDASRLIRLSYVEFDLMRILDEELFSDFAVMYRTLHATRMPSDSSDPSSCLLERYHQDALEDGARIRAGLSGAVEEALKMLGNGFLGHAANAELRTEIATEKTDADSYYLPS